jgi:myosin heavy subunit
MSFGNKIEATFGKGKKCENAYFAKNKTKPELFAVRHFAGPVEYNVTNFLDKNRDSMSQTTRETMLTSTFPLIVRLFEEVSDPGGGAKKGAKMGLGGQFRNQVMGLVSGLKTQEAHFIRCVKPNMPKRPGLFESPLTLRQLRYAGLFEAISIRKSGYAYRASHEAFSKYYGILVDGLSDSLKSGSVKAKDGAKLILERATANGLFPKDLWQVGKTKVFMKNNDMNVLMDRQRSLRCSKYAVFIQAMVRGALIRTKYGGERQAKIAERKRLAEEEARAKAEAIRRANLVHHSCVLIQKTTRKFLVSLAMRSVKDLLVLRSALAKKNIAVAVKYIAKMESSSLPPPGLMPKFTKELMLAKTIIQVVRLQNQLEVDLQEAIDVMDVRAIQVLLLQSDSLEMRDNPVVIRARNEIGSILRRKRIMVDLVEFLQNENDHFDTVLESIQLAKEANVDADFIAKVSRYYIFLTRCIR